ncbi:hypothetical protein [Neobacillus ginsengisoli]|uniref:Uncharacterized protein n=1 Tax=Neobacillus ginsengisoli TaxID=904295 RepID=A0ABT9XZ33_9BACI|nr:hypothetical protein [Neobacillus ginsengisoli]MDQ0200174.1 hypothetical protein [Neobacillus ginsengisoli]
MFDEFFVDLKNWWTDSTIDEINVDEFERVESKHTRVWHDEDIRELIRVH